MADPAVVLHGPDHLAGALAERTGLRVVTPGAAAALAGAPAVVGVGVEPWPAFQAAHEDVRERLGAAPYFAVQAWHQHPAYVEALTEAVARSLGAAGDGTHVLFTAPGPGAEPDPRQVVFLREVAEAVSGALGLARRSIAWVGGATTPTTRTALTALVEAHERTRVLRCSLDPLARPDGVHAEAADLGIELHEARLQADDLPRLLAAVVATVLDHESIPGARP